MTAIDLAALIAFLWFLTIFAALLFEHRKRTGDAVKRAMAKAKGGAS